MRRRPGRADAAGHQLAAAHSHIQRRRRPPFRPMQSHRENSDEPYRAWLMYMKTKEDTYIPSVISISYADDEKSVSPEFAQLGARSVTVLVATGDDGVGKGDDCE